MIDAVEVDRRIEEAAGHVREAGARAPEIAIVLGTGLTGLAEHVTEAVTLPYGEIPGFPVSTVETHAGRLLLGSLERRSVAVLQGRAHLYEGYDLATVTFPIRVLRALGATTLIVSNVSGGMHPLWSPGELVVIADHINLLGDNPLVGTNVDSQGPRFPDMSEAYDASLRAIAVEEALRLGIRAHEGVYVAVSGPNLETAAEYRMLRAIGADVVGMSTVPEVIVARHAGLRVLGLSIITDACRPDCLEVADIETIVGVAREAEPRLTELVRAVLRRA